MADEEIKVLLTVEDSEAIEATKRFQKTIDELVLRMQTLATISKQSLEAVREGMKQVAEERKKIAEDILKSEQRKDPALQEEGLIEAAKQEIKEYAETIKNIGTAFQEAKRQRTEFFKEGDALANRSSKTQQEANKRATAAQREYEKITRQGYGRMSKEAEKYGQEVNKVANYIQQTSQKTGQSWDEIAKKLQQAGVPLNYINNALKQLNTQTQQTSAGFGGFLQQLNNMGAGLTGLGNLASYVFGTVFGLIGIQAVLRLGRAFKEFAEDILRRGAEMTEVIFTLEVAIRGLQRVGLDTTINDWTESIQALKNEFPFFPKREFIEATSLAALMTREFGFTADQIQNIVRQSAILSQITGKDLLESVRGISYAIGSGYFESLQRAGVNISRAVVAQEALRQGYEGVYNELEPAIRASVTYSVITRNLAAIQEDASRKSDVFAGQLQILNATLEDLKNLFGEVVTSSDTFLGALRNLNELLSSIKNVYEALAAFDVDIFTPLTFLLGIDDEIKQIKNLADFINNLAEELEILNSRLRNTRIYIEALAEVAGALGFTTFESAIDSVIEKLFNAERSLGNFVNKLKPTEFDLDTTIGGVEFSEEDYNEILKATEELGKEVFDIEEEWYKQRLDIFSDFSRDMNKIQQDHYRKLQDLRRDHQQKMDAIDIKEGERLADEETSYLNKVADAERDAAFRREEAERKYRERELKQERKFQEKLRQLRENFILDLEDAVRDRDARQIIRLTKQYNLRRDQMIREEAIDKDDRKAAFEEQLRDIERQRAERLRQLQLDHERRNAEIGRQAEQERAKAQEDYERRKADERARADEQKAERKRRRDEQLDDLDDWRAERIAKVIEGLQEEYGLTEEQLNAMVTLWKSKFGTEGEIPLAVDAGVTMVINRLNALAAYMAQFEALKRSIAQQAAFANIPAGGYLGPPPDNAGGQAKGGTIIARRPTVALFGEAGPEMATFTPLNKLADSSMPGGQMMSTRDPQTGRISLEMLLSPDLEARIVDNTLNEVADVVYRIERERR